MDQFKKENNHLATFWDWNINHIYRRNKGDGRILRRLSRRRLKQKLVNAANKGKLEDL